MKNDKRKNQCFDDYNDWLTFRRGKLSIELGFDRKVKLIQTARGRLILGQAETDKWLDEHTDVKKEVTDWLDARDLAAKNWLHNTPHHCFYCDGGTLAVKINGSAVLRVGCGGDGRNKLFVAKAGKDILPPFFKFTGISLDDCTIAPLDYDCDGGNVIFEEQVKSANFYRCEKAIAIVIDTKDKEC